ncbi:uncharacterized protein LOC125023135 [Mugil cephalus]|uniref:uncharacterized protein LOC125023135 n=1 Tax=Mugil cephalus TaxID=48193 RepID=UPI001FB5F164|nr:uncharacterized protein LOC125023135 [Mugil cephalus]
MSFGFILLISLCVIKVNSSTTSPTASTTTTLVTTSGTLLPELVVMPNYPAAIGQRVTLRCSDPLSREPILWSWEHLQNDIWEKVGSGRNLTLTEPKQSGLYRCCAELSSSQKAMSQSQVVYIIPTTKAIVGENLGIAAFVLSLLALSIVLALFFLLGWHRLRDTLTTSSPEAKGFPGPEVASKGALPHADSDATDVYMNYTTTNQAYTDLDPANMTEDNVYSSL